MQLIVSGIIVLCALFIPTAFAEIDLSNQRIISLDGNVIIEFGENTRYFMPHSLKIIPNIGFGVLNLDGGTIFLDSNNVNVLASSFSITLDNGKIYAKNNRDGTFDVKVLTVKNGKFQKEIFPSVIEPIVTSFKEIAPTEQIKSIERENIELLMVGKYSMVTALKDQINFDLRIYDKALNIAQDYHANYGYVPDADITISIKDSQNKIIWFIEDKTNEFGYSEIEFRVESDFRLMGEHLVSILVEHEGNTLKRTIPLFIEEQNADAKWMDISRLE